MKITPNMISNTSDTNTSRTYESGLPNLISHTQNKVGIKTKQNTFQIWQQQPETSNTHGALPMRTQVGPNCFLPFSKTSPVFAGFLQYYCWKRTTITTATATTNKGCLGHRRLWQRANCVRPRPDICHNNKCLYSGFGIMYSVFHGVLKYG